MEKEFTFMKRFAQLALIVLPMTYFVWFGLINGQDLAKSADAWGTFGDYIGGILNPLIAASALYWLIRSVMIQKSELHATKLALEAAQLAQQDQAKTLALQRFDTTFFALLEQHNTILTGLYSIPHATNEARTLFAKKSSVQNVYYSVFTGGVGTLHGARAALDVCGESTGTYFRVLYQLLKLIATKCPGTSAGPRFDADSLRQIASPEETFYSNVVRSFMSKEIVQLLAIHGCVGDPDDERFRYRLLLERYGMLEHMPPDTWGEVGSHTLAEAATIYDRSVFGANTHLLDELRVNAA